MKALWMPLAATKKKRVPDQIKSDFSLKCKFTKLRLLYFGHTMRRQHSLGKIEVSRERGILNMRWIPSIKEAKPEQGCY